MESIDQVYKKAGGLRIQTRRLLIFAALTAAMGSQSATAQTFAEWFKQKSTQKKYLYQQIAALNVYSSYLRSGYQIAKSGLGSIGGYIGKEFDLHGDYYKHLKTVSLVVRNDPQVADIMKWQLEIINTSNLMKDQQGLNRDERTYIERVRQALLDDCDARLHDLQLILADQKTKMSDEDRISQLGRLHRAMQDNYQFAASFTAHLRSYVRSKQQNAQDLNTLTRLYGNH